MLKDTKDRRITVRLTARDYEVVEALSYLAGVKPSAYVRMLINTSVMTARAAENKGVINLEDVKALLDHKLQQ